MRTRLNVTLYIICLSCLRYDSTEIYGFQWTQHEAKFGEYREVLESFDRAVIMGKLGYGDGEGRNLKR
jgi:hypothetical protein